MKTRRGYTLSHLPLASKEYLRRRAGSNPVKPHHNKMKKEIKSKYSKSKAGMIWNLKTGEMTFFDNKGKKTIQFKNNNWEMLRSIKLLKGSPHPKK